MDGRRPRLAIFCRALGLVILAYVLLNAFAGMWFFVQPDKKFLLSAYVLQQFGLSSDPYWVPLAWTAQDTILMVVMGIIFLIANWAATEPPVAEINNLSSTELIQNLESTNVTIKPTSANQQTSAVAQEILKEVLGEKQVVDQDSVANAIGSLGQAQIDNYQYQKGELRDRTSDFDTQFSSLNVKSNPVESIPQVESVPLPSKQNTGAQISGLPVVDSLPLPSKVEEVEPEFSVSEEEHDDLAMPELSDLIGGIEMMLDEPKKDKILTTPQIPDLDDLDLDDAPEIPDIPNLDDIL